MPITVYYRTMQSNEKQRPKVGVGVIIVNNDKVLLGKRKNAHGNGTWAFPGGHLEFGETWEACALRETEEEVGVKISNPLFVVATNDIFTGEDEGKHYVTIYLRAEYLGGEPEIKEPEKWETWEWFDWDALPKPLFLPIEHLLASGYRL